MRCVFSTAPPAAPPDSLNKDVTRASHRVARIAAAEVMSNPLRQVQERKFQMHKKLIALAIAGIASGAAFAQSNVTVYGIVDVG